jgi:hypothetical protein
MIAATLEHDTERQAPAFAELTGAESVCAEMMLNQGAQSPEKRIPEGL